MSQTSQVLSKEASQPPIPDRPVQNKPLQVVAPPSEEEDDEEEQFFVPTQDEIDDLEETQKDKAKRYLLAQSLGLMAVSHDRKLLLATREKVKEIMPLLDSTNREVRVGALIALLEVARQDTMVSKKDLKLMVQRLQPKEVAKPTVIKSTSKSKAKEDSEAIKAVKAKYPNADQRGKDSDYAREIREARMKH